ncbi:MAG: hypothetical protein V1838_02095 [Patescibacteria group bacterium]
MKTELVKVMYRGQPVNVRVTKVGCLRGSDLRVVVTKDFAGMLLVPRWQELAILVSRGDDWRKFRWKEKYRRPQLVTSIYHALRQTYHILDQYGYDFGSGERSVINRARITARELNSAIVSGPKSNSVAQLRRNTAKNIADIRRAVNRPRRLSKIQAEARLFDLDKGTDRLGRYNPSAAATKLDTVYRLLTQRLKDEIMVIDPKIVKRQREIINMIQLAEFYLWHVGNLIDELLKYDGLKPLFNPYRRKQIRIQLWHCTDYLSELLYDPYRYACQQSITDLREIRTILDKGKPEVHTLNSIRFRLKSCWAANGILEQLVEVERIIYRIMQAGYKRAHRFPFLSTFENLKRIDQRLYQLTQVPLRHNPFPDARLYLSAATSLVGEGKRDNLEEAGKHLRQVSKFLAGPERDFVIISTKKEEKK